MMQGHQTEQTERVPVSRAETFQSSTLAGYVRHWAETVPRSTAIADATNRLALGLGAPSRLDYQTLDQLIDRLANLFAVQGLEPGDVIGIQLTNIIECPITVLAAMRAGLIPSLLPMAWRRHELDHALKSVPVQAIVCHGEYTGYQAGEAMCELAFQHMSVRFIFGVGSQLPDGVMPLDDVFKTVGLSQFDQDNAPAQNVAALDDPALISWVTGADGTSAPLIRTHKEVMTAGLMHTGMVGINSGDKLLGTYPLSSLAGLAGMFVPWLLSGAGLVLHEPFDVECFMQDLAGNDITYAILPAPVFAAIHEGRHLGDSAPSLTRMGCVWGARPHIISNKVPKKLPYGLFDIVSIGGLSSIVTPRNDDRPPSGIPLGLIRAGEGGKAAGEILLETRLKGSVRATNGEKSTLMGSLLIRGQLVPKAAAQVLAEKNGGAEPSGTEDWLNTGLKVSIGDDAMHSVQCAANANMIYHGGLTVPAADLDKIYADFADFSDAAAFTISDPFLGERIFAAVVPAPGVTPSIRAFKSYLDGLSIASYKIPEKLVAVSFIPRDGDGHVLRDKILDHL